jgi:hypothetical protein
MPVRVSLSSSDTISERSANTGPDVFCGARLSVEGVVEGMIIEPRDEDDEDEDEAEGEANEDKE